MKAAKVPMKAAKVPGVLFSSLLAAGFPQDPEAICMLFCKLERISIQKGPPPAPAWGKWEGTISGKRRPGLHLPNSHPSIVRHPLQTLVQTPLFPHSKQEDSEEKSLAWVFSVSVTEFQC